MNTLLIGLLIVGGFCVWKFIVQPIMNEGKPIEPKKGEKTFGEQIEEAMDPSTDL